MWRGEKNKFKKKDKILILSSTFGEGHQQVAIAIREAVQSRLPDAEPVVVDFMAVAHSYLYPISRYVYMKGVKKLPSLYGYFYQKTRRVNPFSIKLNSFLSTGMGRMLKLLQEVQPSVVVSTFPFAAGVMSKLKECRLTNIPSVTIITDYTDHSYWIHRYTDQYIVGSSLVRHALNRQGIADSKIADTGIPIKSKFYEHYSRKDLSIKYGLDFDLPTIMVMGGGHGMIRDGLLTFRELDALPQPIQLIIVCGHNEKLRHQLKEELKDSKHCIHLTGYIDYVHELMAISDFIITKPGGITISEAMAMKLPMLLYSPLPGQEQDNAQFLVQAGVAMQAENLADLRKKLFQLLYTPKFLVGMKENVKRFHMKGTNFDALDVIVRTKQQSLSLIFTPDMGKR
ncbi:MGDG synthase family glycosyltransferase [Neobacillus sp.]|uniref:MGDG synthase family glycosyltransferase n=1 Tax=Neobacillus sp. TaxID=2675273 RepID=UPI00289DB16D|nr:glycosyltransferase [Neobacillus sp.]